MNTQHDGDREDAKPGIYVLPESTDTDFVWVSDGWFEEKIAHTKRARRLMTLAHDAIDRATDMNDAVRRLRDAGFMVIKGR